MAMYGWQSRPDGSYCRVHVQPSQRNRTRNRTIRDSSSSGTVRRSAVRSNTAPCWIDREVVPAADQDFARGSCAHHGCSMETEWIGNDKSPSHRLGHLSGWIQVWMGVSQAQSDRGGRKGCLTSLSQARGPPHPRATRVGCMRLLGLSAMLQPLSVTVIHALRSTRTPPSDSRRWGRQLHQRG